MPEKDKEDERFSWSIVYLLGCVLVVYGALAWWGFPAFAVTSGGVLMYTASRVLTNLRKDIRP